jgi:hypothetical protein
LLADRIGSTEVGKDADIKSGRGCQPAGMAAADQSGREPGLQRDRRFRARCALVAGEHLVVGGWLTKVDEDKLYAEIPVVVARFAHLKLDQMLAAALAGVRNNRSDNRAEKKSGRRDTPWRMCSASISRRFRISRLPHLLAQYRARDHPDKLAIVDLDQSTSDRFARSSAQLRISAPRSSRRASAKAAACCCLR